MNEMKPHPPPPKKKNLLYLPRLSNSFSYANVSLAVRMWELDWAIPIQTMPPSSRSALKGTFSSHYDSQIGFPAHKYL